MADDKPTLTRRRALGGLATIGAAGAVGAGTWAKFSDTDSGHATVRAGTLDLDVTNTSFQATNVYPGDSGQWQTKLTNPGSVAGKLMGAIVHVDNHGGDHPDPEDSIDDNSGDLSSYLELAFRGAGGIVQPGTFNTLDWYEGHSPFLIDSNMTGSESHTLTIEWKVPSGVGNIIQGDWVEFDLEATLTQK